MLALNTIAIVGKHKYMLPVFLPKPAQRHLCAAGMLSCVICQIQKGIRQQRFMACDIAMFGHIIFKRHVFSDMPLHDIIAKLRCHIMEIKRFTAADRRIFLQTHDHAHIIDQVCEPVGILLGTHQ